MTTYERAAVSFSRMKTFRQCPRKAWHDQYAPKDHPDRMPYVPSPQTGRGKEIHKALEDFAARGRPLPKDLERLSGLAAYIKSLVDGADARYFEARWAWNRDLEERGFFDDDAWWRVQNDFVVVRGTEARLLDYKTGKVYPDERQLEDGALAVMLRHPLVKIVRADFVWLDHDDQLRALVGLGSSPRAYTADEMEWLFGQLVETSAEIDKCVAFDYWPATPSKFGCGYCTANKKGVCEDARYEYAGAR